LEAIEDLGYARHFRLLKKQYLSIPPLDEQKRIVAKLDECFEAIDKARANVERNLNNAKELFQSKLNENFSQKGDGWVEKRWGKLCQFVRGPFGGSLKKSMFKESGYVVYEQKHAIHDHFTQLRYFIDEEKFNEMKRFEVKPGDLIMSCSGVTLGKVAIIPEGIQKGIINQALLKLTPYDNVLSEFLKHWIRSKIFQDIIFKYSGGAAIPNVPSAKILKGIRVSIPNINVQKDIVEKLDELKSQTQSLESNYQQELDALHELKKSILQKAFNGEL
jgi:type I restriction enzyme S subunit